MTSEASSTTNSSRKRKLVDSEVDEVFVLQKNPEVRFTKTVSFSIADLLEKINDENNKGDKITTPRFKLGNLDFCFDIYLNDENDEGYVELYLHNSNRDDKIISLRFIETPNNTTFDDGLNHENIEAGGGFGWPKFMSHDDYREWAGQNGDVFKITATVTLHQREESSAKWTTIR